MTGDDQAVGHVGVVTHRVINKAVGEPEGCVTSNVQHFGKRSWIAIKIAFHVGLLVELMHSLEISDERLDDILVTHRHLTPPDF